MQPETFREFQRYVWETLPVRKHRLGKEVIYDSVAVVIQEWPEEAFQHARSGDTGEVAASDELTKSVKRHLALAYGESKFGSLWLLALQIMLPVIIDLILRWWRRDDENKKRLRVWRRDWVNGISEE